jgi:predicted ABC-type ATPase
MGGHDVKDEDVRRRFYRSRENFVKLYLPVAKRWVVWDAGQTPPMRLATWTEDDIKAVEKLLI